MSQALAPEATGPGGWSVALSLQLMLAVGSSVAFRERDYERAVDLSERAFELALVEHTSGREARAVAIQTGASHRQQLALVHVVKEIGTGRVDQADAATDQRERARIREPP